MFRVINPSRSPADPRWLLPVAVLLLIGCAPAAEDPGYAPHEFTLTESEGSLLAVNRGGPRFAGPLFRFELTERIRLELNPENEPFIWIRSHIFQRDEAGFIYVVDDRNRIAVFDPDGNYSSGIGREGEGPGEFRWISHLQIRGDILQVYDVPLSRITRIRTDGNLLDTHALNIVRSQGAGASQSITFTWVLPDGSLAVGLQERRDEGPFRLERSRYVLFGTDREIEWELSTPEYRQYIRGEYGGGRSLSIPMPFPRSGSISFDPDHGVLVFKGDEPVLRHYDLQGSLVREIRVERAPRPFTAEDRARVSEEYDHRIATAAESQVEMWRAVRAGLVFPDHWPLWQSASLDDAGFIWLHIREHSADQEAAGAGALFQVLSPQGEYLGEVRNPHGRGTGIRSRGDLLVMNSDQETGEVHVTVYRMVAAVPGLYYP